MKKKLYGSRFSRKTLPEVDDFISSINVDKKLIEYDLRGSIAHAKMLGKQKIITSKETSTLIKGLKLLLSKAEKGKLNPLAKKYPDEDVHTYVTNLLKEKISKEIADKLHTARSRNDQVSLDTRMYCLDKLDDILKGISKLQKSIYNKAKKYIDVVMPVYTHLQPAEAISASHLFCAYLETLEKDKTRLKNAKENTDYMTLGSCAARGIALDIDRRFVAKELGFTKISQNSIEAISSRDFIIEILSDIVILAVNLSRIAEDLILYSTYEFNFVEIDEGYLTGSSMMPNKRNADTLELIRGFAAKTLGAFVEVSSLMKGLPHAYNRDMQLDKEPLFRSTEGIIKCLSILEGIFATLKLEEGILKEYIRKNDYIFATDICVFLIKKGLSYRKAHDVTGEIIKYASKRKKMLKELTDKELKRFSKFLNEKEIKKLTNPYLSVKSVKSEGGTSFESVNKQLSYWKKILK